mmetsp:Transcript_30226/g.63749  ORF Transcript_30226/g.63749 Transcript_30226/m.63749 type:complete len:261 (+) Transcript_30226:133-915(+)
MHKTCYNCPANVLLRNILSHTSSEKGTGNCILGSWVESVLVSVVLSSDVDVELSSDVDIELSGDVSPSSDVSVDPDAIAPCEIGFFGTVTPASLATLIRMSLLLFAKAFARPPFLNSVTTSSATSSAITCTSHSSSSHLALISNPIWISMSATSCKRRLLSILRKRSSPLIVRISTKETLSPTSNMSSTAAMMAASNDATKSALSAGSVGMVISESLIVLSMITSNFVTATKPTSMLVPEDLLLLDNLLLLELLDMMEKE